MDELITAILAVTPTPTPTEGASDPTSVGTLWFILVASIALIFGLIAWSAARSGGDDS